MRASWVTKTLFGTQTDNNSNNKTTMATITKKMINIHSDIFIHTCVKSNQNIMINSGLAPSIDKQPNTD